MDLPIYKISINQDLSKNGEKLGIDQIAFTSDPAILVKGVAFNSKQMRFTDESKLRVIAPIMIPMHVYRFDNDGEYFVEFDRQTVEEMFKDYKQNPKGRNLFNLDHKQNKQVPQAYELEVWLVEDTDLDKSQLYGIDVPVGSVMMVAQFTDKEFFQKEIIEKGRTGFSIEGFMGLELVTQIKSRLKKNKPKAEIKLFTKSFLNDGTAIMIDSKTKQVFTINENKKELIKDGEYNLKDGSTIRVMNGMYEGEILIIKNNMKRKFTAAYLADGKPVWYEDLKEGIEIYTVDESMEQIALADGSYELASGEKIEVKDGKIASINAEATVEVEKTNETPIEGKADEMPVAPTMDEAAVMAIVQPKIDEIIKMIADLRAIVEAAPAEETIEVEGMKRTSNEKHQRMSAINGINKFLGY